MAPLTAGGAPGDFSLTFLLHGGAHRGRLVRLDETTAEILGRHAYPPAVARLCAETAALAVALAFSMKFDGVFTLQAQGDGPVRQLVADVTSGGAVRAYAGFAADSLDAAAAAGEDVSLQRLLGAGHLAFTVDRGAGMTRYQGIVPLEGATLADCIHQYFRQSEQLETAIKVASAPIETAEGRTVWRAAAVMLQRMPGETADVDDEEARDDAWRTAVILLGSLTALELLDPALAAERVLHRLFHSEGLAIAGDRRALAFGCRCSRRKVVDTLAAFPPDDIGDMVQADGTIAVTCQFCSSTYILERPDIDALTVRATRGSPDPH
jgi:molecular chaperone Hsp33